MNRRNIPLDTLDKYAKILSSKQVNMLYESKIGTNKQSRLLLEEDDPDSIYSVFIPTKVYERYGISPYDLINTLQYGDKEKGDKEVTDVSFKTKDASGILVVCKFPLSFKEILGRIVNTGMGNDVARYVKPEKFQICLYPEDADVDI